MLLPSPNNEIQSVRKWEARRSGRRKAGSKVGEKICIGKHCIVARCRNKKNIRFDRKWVLTTLARFQILMDSWLADTTAVLSELKATVRTSDRWPAWSKLRTFSGSAVFSSRVSRNSSICKGSISFIRPQINPKGWRSVFYRSSRAHHSWWRSYETKWEKGDPHCPSPRA